MLEPLWGKSLYSRSQALCEVLPGKAWVGTVIQEAVWGSLSPAGPSHLDPTGAHKEHCGPTQPPRVLEGGVATLPREKQCLGPGLSVLLPGFPTETGNCEAREPGKQGAWAASWMGHSSMLRGRMTGI